jgi:phosphatidylglycerophosphatase A
MSDNNYKNCKGVPLLHLILSTGFGTGFIPYAPGTAGALLALLIWWVLYCSVSLIALTIITSLLIVGVTVIGVWTSNIMEKYWGKDPRAVNIDEFVGTWIPLLVAPCGEYTWLLAMLGFFFFRGIDIWKPLGCKRMETIQGGWGVMLDDVLAGIYALILIGVVKLVIVV